VDVGDVVSAIDAKFPFGGAGAWDRVGLQVGNTERKVSSVAVCHEVTPHVVEQARATGVDVLVTYHPLLFEPVTAFVAGPSPTGRALALAESGISLIVVHTAFDVARPGTADALLEVLGFEVSDTFGPVDEDGGADIGRIADLPKPQSLGSLALSVGSATGWVVRYNMPSDRQISRVGVVPGSGDSFIEQAIGKVDCYITGDVSHHGANRARDEGLSIIDAGHVPSELPGVQSLYSQVVELVPTATLLDGDAHPWRV
jgi:dinuclear metal center YbgI/SA1388 family protein